MSLLDNRTGLQEILEMVNALEEGGAGGVAEIFPGSGLTWETGCFTVATDMTSGSYKITHSLGKMPTAVILYAISGYENEYSIVTSSLVWDNEGGHYMMTGSLVKTSLEAKLNASTIITPYVGSVDIRCGTNAKMLAGTTYVYAIGG